MSYSAKVIREQGGSVLRIASGGSLNIESGGKFGLGDSPLLFGALNPTNAALNASPGALYIRSDGSASNMYINKSTGTAGSVWAATSANIP